MTTEQAPRVGALLIHGLGGTQYDLGPMHKVLRRGGVETHAVTLPGHGGTPDDLLHVRAEAWMDSVTQAYDALADQYDTFHVIGMCMGALLAVALAERRQHRKGKLVALSAPVYIDGWSTPPYRWLRHVVYHLPVLPARIKVEENEPFGIKNDLVRAIVKAKFERGDNFHYRWVPLTCIRQVDRLRRWVLDGARRVPCQTLVVHAREDELTSVRSADFLLANVPQAQGVVVENSYHMICVDNDREQVMTSVAGFLGLEAGAARVRARRTVEAPMPAEAVQALVQEYLAALTTRHFETIYPQLDPGIVWRHVGNHPLAGEYGDRDAVIGLFQRLEQLAGESIRIDVVGAPRIDGQTVEVDIAVSYQLDGAPMQGHGTQTLQLRNGRIAAVEYRSAMAAAGPAALAGQAV
ncbi:MULTISPECIES: alpha/beta fold hydrolase [unclassified Cupriavidus]|uniref:alpha/beta fold hydrolase n=1 Tax=unclassified Cupriavidus TaxID=2640874 RepID=UPI001C004B03|nr:MULTISPECIES: alpha/beta fold hydrolase [unclassified Cupriavidus]MCA3185456.1 alpha/beta fold hydrolase [Cupriavidus sp.]MCA3192943.1 alpha/beta fold hydrolase [Cupriavidus sp.]MCA3195795.1 alpha/beta fold hydrolase [Cupriavidus sp.]MCA3204696.1 alpha/beta fold hydrolase [Cupriavidus sp.]MCA3206828.1 alpha/beta fold hydrolase [Cupriavidus sp.]